MIFNMGSTPPTFSLTVSGHPNATVTVTDGKNSVTQVTDINGSTVFTKLKKGEYTVTATAGSETYSYKVPVYKNSANSLNINAIPEFTYNGSYEIVNDSGSKITSAIKNWNIRFLETSEIELTKLNGAADGIDIFCVGGGGNGSNGGTGAYKGAGGGGGRTVTARGKSVSTGKYVVTIGGACGASSFGNLATAEGGYSAIDQRGGDGGSGGGSTGKDGGSNGSDGTTWTPDWGYVGGAGLDERTDEFHEDNGILYAGGGGGAFDAAGSSTKQQGKGGAGGGGNGADTHGGAGYSGEKNTGGGGGGGNPAGAGGSGIVIIRNKR